MVQLIVTFFFGEWRVEWYLLQLSRILFGVNRWLLASEYIVFLLFER